MAGVLTGLLLRAWHACCVTTTSGDTIWDIADTMVLVQHPPASGT